MNSARVGTVPEASERLLGSTPVTVSLDLASAARRRSGSRRRAEQSASRAASASYAGEEVVRQHDRPAPNLIGLRDGRAVLRDLVDRGGQAERVRDASVARCPASPRGAFRAAASRRVLHLEAVERRGRRIAPVDVIIQSEAVRASVRPARGPTSTPRMKIVSEHRRVAGVAGAAVCALRQRSAVARQRQHAAARTRAA